MLPLCYDKRRQRVVRLIPQLVEKGDAERLGEGCARSWREESEPDSRLKIKETFVE